MKTIDFCPAGIVRPVEEIDDVSIPKAFEPLEVEFRLEASPLQVHHERCFSVVRGGGNAAIDLVGINNTDDALAWPIQLPDKDISPPLIDPHTRRSQWIRAVAHDWMTIRGRKFFFSTIYNPHIQENQLRMRVDRGTLIGVETNEGVQYVEQDQSASCAVHIVFREEPRWLHVFELIEKDRFGPLYRVRVFAHTAAS